MFMSHYATEVCKCPILCLRFPNRQFECETMSLAGICWNMMASSVFFQKSDFRKIIITEKICLAYQIPPKVLIFPYVFVLLRQKKRRHLQRILGRNHDWYLMAYKNIEICLKIFRDPQKRPLNGHQRVLSFSLTRRNIKA